MPASPTSPRKPVQIYIRRDIADWLKAEKERSGVPVSRIIEQAISKRMKVKGGSR
jgi:hypothetical protein